MSFTLTLTSRLPLPMEIVWEKVSTMSGVNDELKPLLYMTSPAHVRHLPFTGVPTHKVLFSSWLLLFGWLPVDRHSLQLNQVWEGGFCEKSHSLMHRYWRHERRIVSHNDECFLTDTLQFEPYMTILGYFLLPIVRMVFQHRHWRLQQWSLTHKGKL